MGNFCSRNPHDQSPAQAAFSFQRKYLGIVFENLNGDICEENVDVIVSAANNRLSHNNGLANSIVVRGGASIQEESDRIIEENDGPLCAGSVAITSGGQLRAKTVLHVVSPVWTGGEKREEERLGEAITNTLNKAVELKAESIAIPSISSGIFGFPKAIAAQVIVRKTLEFFDAVGTRTSFKRIKFINSDMETVKCFKSELESGLLYRANFERASSSSPSTIEHAKGSLTDHRISEMDGAHLDTNMTKTTLEFSPKNEKEHQREEHMNSELIAH